VVRPRERASIIRLAIADDHTLFREGVRRLLESEPEFEVVGEAANGMEAVALVQESRPDFLLLDLAMPGQDGLEALRDIVALGTPCRVVLLTAEIDSTQTVQALRAGARGIVMKHAACQLLCKGIRAVKAGEYWIGRDAVADLMAYLNTQEAERASPAKARFGLTARELQIVALVVEGGTNREIAESLGLSDDTVKHHLSNIFDKVGVHSRLELGLFAVNHGLIDDQWTRDGTPPPQPGK
jgi:DNA-binding NarL/FixJ family response regulator